MEYYVLMIILGIDPGYATVGYGVIEVQRGKFRVLDDGAVTTPAGLYWSSSPHAAYGPRFASYFLFMCDGAGIGYDSRSGGNAVRLVKDL